jgi:hypothetical protein
MQSNKLGKFNLILSSLLGIFVLAVLFVEITLCITPPVARDALIHHLAIPKLWLQNGGFYETPWAAYSYYPMNIDLLYLIPLYFRNDVIPSLIHMAFGIGTALLIYLYLRSISGRVAGLLGILIFISTPIIVRMSTVAYVDLGLTFFTTASLFSFVCWRNGDYKDHKWLFLSSVAMGLALGTKYNALISWFFLSLATVFVYSRDTKEQANAIRYGMIFFFASLLVFSPWLIKNIILTGNPLYPLLKGIFSIGSENGTQSMVTGDTYLGIFKAREILYGEGFWETLLVPIRFFFQGQDHSDRYFDGILNPILIILVPFAFVIRSKYKNRILFLLFACFYIFMAFLLDQLRIRYILPVVPVLTILTVIGLINIYDLADSKIPLFRYFIIFVTSCFIIVMISKNILYINNYFKSVAPLNYVSGKESRDEFIQRHVKSYAAIKYINKHTSPQSKIRLILLAGRGYYLDRPYEEDASMGMDIIRKLAEKSDDDKSFDGYLDDLACTHLLINMNMFQQYLQGNYPTERIERLFRQLNKSMSQDYYAEGYALYSLRSQRHQ